MKVVINTRYGGYSVSEKAGRRLAELGCDVAAKDVAEFDENLAEWERTGVNPQYGATASDGLRKMRPLWYGFLYDVERHDPLLVQVVEELGPESYGRSASLKVVEIPDGVEYVIDEYDGLEHIAEVHRTWC